MTGILTFHDGINYGAFLQAYALQKTVEQIDGSTLIINYKSPRFTWREYVCFLKRRNPLAFAANLMKIVAFRLDQRRLRCTRRIYGRQVLSGMSFDNVVIGSDAVWHFTSPLCGYDPTYFGAGINTGRLIAYAVSCGPDSSRDGWPDELPGLLARFERVGIRDTNTGQFVQDVAGRETTPVLDPTLLYDFDAEALTPRESNYIAVYAKDLEEDYVQAIRDVAAATGRQLISIGYRNPWCDVNRFVLSPFRWLGYIAHADLVITSMYHGTLLATKLGRPFCTVVTPYRANKLEDFLRRVDLEDRMVHAAGDVRSVCESPTDWDSPREKLQAMVELSTRFLRDALEGDEKP